MRESERKRKNLNDRESQYKRLEKEQHRGYSGGQVEH